MKKLFTLCMAVAIGALLFVGCKKDSNVVMLRCYVERSNAKGYIDMTGSGTTNDPYIAYPAFFTSDAEGTANGYFEKVNVNGAEYIIAPETNHSFSVAITNPVADYYAIYPASVVASGASVNSTSVNVTLPYTQSYREKDGHQIVDLPMGAVSTGNQTVTGEGSDQQTTIHQFDDVTMEFKNLCSVLEVRCTNTTGSPFTIAYIEVQVDGVGLAGTGTATLGGESPSISIEPTDINQKIVFEIPPADREEVEVGHESPAYQIILPPFNNKTIHIKVRTEDGKKSAAKYKTGFSLGRNSIYRLLFPISQVEEKQDNELSGYFSVSPTKKVVFSKGNLQAYKEDGVWKWKFADHQYDFYGRNNFNPASASTTTAINSTKRDLFLLSTNYTSSQYGLNFGLDATQYGNSFVDWGANHIEGDPANTTNIWRTLTLVEWHALIGNVGTNSTGTNSDVEEWVRPNAENLRARAYITLPTTTDYSHPASYTSSGTAHNVTSVYGFLILPDNWTTPYGITLNTGTSGNPNVYDYETWTRLEAAGAMFLPAFGTVHINMGTSGVHENDNLETVEIYASTSSEYKDGYYWSSTPVFSSTAVEAKYLYYNYNTSYAISWQYGNSQSKSFYDAMFVRLVKNAPTATSGSNGGKK